MDKLGVDELRKAFESLMKATKCAVCLEVLKLETVVCVNGHVICRDCKRTQRSCPTCRKAFSNVENTAFIRQVLEVIPHTCRHKGCPQVVYKGDEHEKYCKYRYEQCRFLGCTEGYLVQELSQHCKSSHTGKWFEANAVKTTSSDFQRIKNNTILDTFGHLFYVGCEYSPSVGVLTITVHPVLTGKPTHDVFCNVTFESDKKLTTFVTKVDLDFEETPADKNTISVPVAVLLQFWDVKEKKLIYSTSISKVKK